jgi:dihydroflavonol-4-reductase
MLVGITGASGHLGNVVCRTLIDRGYQVRVLHRKDIRSFEDINVQRVVGDVLDLEAVDKFVQGCDYVIHSAAIISIHGDPTGIVFKTNTEGPKNIAEACIKHKVKRLIHVSSTHAVMELPFETPFDETRPYKQKGSFAYDFSKSTGEQLMLKYFREGKLDGFVVRPSSVIGPFDYRPSEIGKALLDFYNRKIPVLPPGGYNFIDVRDISVTIVNALEKGKCGEIYLLSGEYYSMKNFAKVVHETSGKKVPKMVMPFWFLKMLLPFVKLYGKMKKANPVFTIEAITALKYGHPNMVNEKAKKELGHVCRPLKETIADFYKWNKERKVIQ